MTPENGSRALSTRTYCYLYRSETSPCYQPVHAGSQLLRFASRSGWQAVFQNLSTGAESANSGALLRGRPSRGCWSNRRLATHPRSAFSPFTAPL